MYPFFQKENVMAIEPNTTIKVYHNIPLDITQDRSIAWANIGEQEGFFHNPLDTTYLVATFSETTYQRVNKGRMRIERTADDLYDCNYLAFQNTNYGNKWFYAFITSVEYVNDITSEITYVIDDLQTWYFDMNLQPCVVERCHTTTDVIGEHIEPEPVTLGEYVMNYTKSAGGTVTEEYGELTPLSALCIIVAIVDVDHNFVVGKMYDGIYGSASLWAYNTDPAGVAAVNQKIIDYIVTPQSIISIYMIPKSLIPATIPDAGYEIPNATLVNPVRVVRPAVNSSFKLDGYTPRNKKLYTYPYHYYHVDNSNGTSLKLRYEMFDQLQPRFEITATITQPCEVMLRPYAYKNCTSDAQAQVFQKTLNTETLTLNMFPMCSWNTDGFQAWIVNSGIPYGINAIGSAIDLVTGAGFGGYTGGQIPASQRGQDNPNYNYQGFSGGGIGSMISSGMMQYYNASITGDITKGNFSNAGVNCATGKQTFYGGRCSITAQYARVIDDFFDKYGYTIMRLQTPNLRARPHWTYIKTRDCAMKGNIPTVSKHNICSYFNKGITFWKVPSEVGNYALNNTV